MEKYSNWFIVFFISIVLAILLFLLNILRQNKKHKGLSRLVFSMLLGLLIFNGQYLADKSYAQSADKDETFVKSTPRSRREIRKLNRNSDWQKFKKFWQKVGAIEPISKNKNSYAGQYTGALSSADSEILRKNTKTIFTNTLKKLVDKDLISAYEMQALTMVLAARVDYIVDGMWTRMTRMMPPPDAVARDDSIMRLEQKIDVLIDLKKKQHINQKEFDKAMKAIKKEIKMYLILNTKIAQFGRFNYEHFSLTFMDNSTNTIEDKALKNIEISISNLNKEEANYTNNMAKYMMLKNEIMILKNSINSLNILIEELEE